MLRLSSQWKLITFCPQPIRSESVHNQGGQVVKALATLGVATNSGNSLDIYSNTLLIKLIILKVQLAQFNCLEGMDLGIGDMLASSLH